MHSFNKVQGCQVWFLFPRNQLSVGSQKSGCLEQAGEERLLWGRERAAAVSSIISFPELLQPSHQSPVLLTLTYPSWAGLFWDPFQPLESSDSPEQFPSVPLGSFPSSSSHIPTPSWLQAGTNISLWSGPAPTPALGRLMPPHYTCSILAFSFAPLLSCCSAPQRNSARPAHQSKHF